MIETNKNLLKAFPESVIIHSIDEVTKQTLIKFANDDALENLLKLQDPIDRPPSESYKPLRVRKYVNIGSDTNMLSTENVEEFNSISDLLEYHEGSLNLFEENVSNIEILEENSSPISGFSTQDMNTVYTLKSLKVKWQNEADSVLHVFINTSHIKKLEKEKANNKALHLMFSSVSHEFRTPLNAFDGALSLIETNFEKLTSILSQFRIKEKDDIVRLNQINTKTPKFFRIARASSSIIMNLTEDILDLAKLESGIFKLNIDSFPLSKLLTDIRYIFELQ